MNTLSYFVLFLQACLIQTVLGQYKNVGQGIAGKSMNPGLLGPNQLGANAAVTSPGFNGARYPNDLSSASARPVTATPPAMYSGTGEGGVSVAGDLPVAGTAVINGQVPMAGAVKFSGNMPASGTVTITGTYSCGCNGPLI